MQEFSGRLIAWQRQYGRHGLPWQQTRDPYRVWLSEIMLQQTQVATVLAYYPRFLAAFPSVQQLAAASQEEVMALWSGLGYYSRARNLHRCAQAICSAWGGEFPATAEALQTLPGIGPSTAAAIVAFCFAERISIFDANVQRVMARVFAYDKDLSRTPHQRELLHRAQQLLPSPEPEKDFAQRMVAYTQGLMDLGATVCTPRKPDCLNCPVAVLCQAQQLGKAEAYPVKLFRLRRTSENWWLLILLRQQPDGKTAVWLQQRPSSGIWGGLHCPLVFKSEAELVAALAGLPNAEKAQWHASIKHALTHKDLNLHLVSVLWQSADAPLTGIGLGQWYADWQNTGLPAPVRKWFQTAIA